MNDPMTGRTRPRLDLWILSLGLLLALAYCRPLVPRAQDAGPQAKPITTPTMGPGATSQDGQTVRGGPFIRPDGINTCGLVEWVDYTFTDYRWELQRRPANGSGAWAPFTGWSVLGMPSIRACGAGRTSVCCQVAFCQGGPKCTMGAPLWVCDFPVPDKNFEYQWRGCEPGKATCGPWHPQADVVCDAAAGGPGGCPCQCWPASSAAKCIP